MVWDWEFTCALFRSLGSWEFGSSHGSPCDSRGSHGWEFGSSARSHGFARFTLVFCAVHMVGDWNLKYLK